MPIKRKPSSQLRIPATNPLLRVPTSKCAPSLKQSTDAQGRPDESRCRGVKDNLWMRFLQIESENRREFKRLEYCLSPAVRAMSTRGRRVLKNCNQVWPNEPQARRGTVCRVHLVWRNEANGGLGDDGFAIAIENRAANAPRAPFLVASKRRFASLK